MRRALICAAVMAALAGEASAAPHQAEALGHVDVIGRLLHAPNVSTGGRDVPLRNALERIVPADYSIILPNVGAWAETPVSWHAGQPFVAALREILAGLPEVSARIDTNTQMVTVRSRALPFGAATASAPPELGGESAVPSSPSPSAADPAPAAGNGTTREAPPIVAAASAQPPRASASASASASTSVPTAAPAVRAAAGAPQTDSPGIQKAAPRPAAQTIASASKAGAEPVATDAAQAATFPVPTPEVSRSWQLQMADHTVKTALGRWAREAGWQLVWNVPTDFGIDADATVTGTFEDALQAVVHALDKGDTPIQAILYKGNKVLRIVARGAAS